MCILVAKTVLCFGLYPVALSTMTSLRTSSEVMGVDMHGRFICESSLSLICELSILKILRGTLISDNLSQTLDNRLS